MIPRFIPYQPPPSGGGSNTISFVGSAIGPPGNTGTLPSSFNIGALGLSADDLCIIIDQAFNFDSGSPSVPASATPSGFSLVGSSATASVSGLAGRSNVWFKVLTGLETIVTGMSGAAGGSELDGIAMVFRKSGGTWQTPTSAINAMVLTGSGVATDQTVTGLTAPYVMIASANASSSTQNLATTPSCDAQVYNAVSLTMGYLLKNTGSGNLVMTHSADRAVLAGCAVAVA